MTHIAESGRAGGTAIHKNPESSLSEAIRLPEPITPSLQPSQVSRWCLRLSSSQLAGDRGHVPFLTRCPLQAIMGVGAHSSLLPSWHLLWGKGSGDDTREATAGEGEGPLPARKCPWFRRGQP